MALVRIAVLATASMFWPLLLVVVVIAFESSHPARILVAFYVGGFLTATGVGSALVFVLEDSPLMHGSRLPSAPWFDVALGLLALVLALVCRIAHRRRLRDRAAPGRVNSSRIKGWIERRVERGGPLAFAGGVVGSFIPGPCVLLGMADIAQLGYSSVATLVVMLGFYVIVFAFIEVPIGGSFSSLMRRAGSASARRAGWTGTCCGLRTGHSGLSVRSRLSAGS